MRISVKFKGHEHNRKHHKHKFKLTCFNELLNSFAAGIDNPLFPSCSLEIPSNVDGVSKPFWNNVDAVADATFSRTPFPSNHTLSSLASLNSSLLALIVAVAVVLLFVCLFVCLFVFCLQASSM